MDENTNGFHCGKCFRLFTVSEVIEEEFSLLQDNMYGRPPSPVNCVQNLCPYCGSTRLEPVWLCEACLSTQPAPGSDLCLECLVEAEREERRVEEETQV